MTRTLLGCARCIAALGSLFLGTGGDAEGAYRSVLSQTHVESDFGEATLIESESDFDAAPDANPESAPDLLFSLLPGFGLTQSATGGAAGSPSGPQSHPNPTTVGLEGNARVDEPKAVAVIRESSNRPLPDDRLWSIFEPPRSRA